MGIEGIRTTTITTILTNGQNRAGGGKREFVRLKPDLRCGFQEPEGDREGILEWNVDA